MKPVLLSGGTLVDPSQDLDEPGDVLVSEGRITGVDRSIERAALGTNGDGERV
jgi:predicted amidohydrolase